MSKMGMIGMIGALAILAATVQAAEWDAQLQGGGTLRVDPDTNRATVIRHGVAVPMWDGVHRLEDGSSIIVRSGVAVPNAGILEARGAAAARAQAGKWEDVPIVGYSPCERLAREVCGAAKECAATPACSPASQLLQMEQQERAAARNHNLMTYSSGQCQESLLDRQFFVPCGQAAAPAPPSPLPAAAVQAPAEVVSPSVCQSLVNKVCGERDQCAGAPGCGAARQLLTLYVAEGKGSSDSAVAPSLRLCEEAMRDETYFAACRHAP